MEFSERGNVWLRSAGLECDGMGEQRSSKKRTVCEESVPHCIVLFYHISACLQVLKKSYFSDSSGPVKCIYRY
jgi:hypothetical protein